MFIRPARAADIPVLCKWDNEPHVIQATSSSGTVVQDDDWEDELAPRDDGTSHWIGQVGDTPIGVMQIIDPARERTHYWGECENNLRAIDIWIGEKEFLNKGFGSRMYLWAISECFAPDEVTAIVIDPLSNNEAAHRFYKRFGFQFVEQRLFDDDSDCFVFRLERKHWEQIREKITLEMPPVWH